MDFIEPCFGIGHNLSLICQMTSEDIKHQLIILTDQPRLQPRSATITLSRCHVTTLFPPAGPLSRHQSLPARCHVTILSPPAGPLSRHHSLTARCHVTTLSPPAGTSPLSPRPLACCHVTTLSPPAVTSPLSPRPLARHHSLPARWPGVTSPLSPRPLACCHVTTLSPLAGPLSRHHSPTGPLSQCVVRVSSDLIDSARS